MRRCSWANTLLYWSVVAVCLLVFWVGIGAAAGATSTGLEGRLIVGYQGWFGCPGDYEGNTQWQHWFFKNIADADHLKVDLLPSLSQLDPQDLCTTDLRRQDGSSVLLYSSQNERVVATHFKWMEEHGIDGAAVQRFVSILSNTQDKRRSDHAIVNAMAGAEAAGRVFFISYDVTGASPQTVINTIRSDWQYLVNDLKLTSSPSYLHVNGKPVLEIWGFGFTDRPGSPGEVSDLITNLKGGTGGLPAATLIGGVPTNWRTLTGDSKTDPAWAPVYRSFDVISPWSVGRFADTTGIDNFIQAHVIPDMVETKSLQIGYLPVIFPGFSWYNLQTRLGSPQSAILNQIPRQCGEFLWHQVHGMLGAAGVEMLYAAMFDEVDEATALFPTVTQQIKLPLGADMVSLDSDGCSLPDDWYLRVTGRAASYLHNHQIPPKSLQGAMGAVPSLAASFDTLGLWVFQNSTWAQLKATSPDKVATYGQNLVASFPGEGIYEYDGAAFTRISANDNIENMLGADRIYVDAGDGGLYQWNGAWTRISAANPKTMAASGSTLYVDFTPYGLWQWDGTTWTHLLDVQPAGMAASGTNLYANFGVNGLWRWNGSAWAQISACEAKKMSASGSTLYADFTPWGLWQWNGDAWLQIHSAQPVDMVVSGTNLFADYGDSGLWQWNGSYWNELSPTATGNMDSTGTNLYVTFDAWGIWSWNGSAWAMLSSQNPAQIIAIGN